MPLHVAPGKARKIKKSRLSLYYQVVKEGHQGLRLQVLMISIVDTHIKNILVQFYEFLIHSDYLFHFLFLLSRRPTKRKNLTPFLNRNHFCCIFVGFTAHIFFVGVVDLCQ